MDKEIEKQLLKIAKKYQTKTDPSHDFNHVLRVLNLAKLIGKQENADLDVLVPAAIFHDIIVYRKDDPRSKHETDESSKYAEGILRNIKLYPKHKIKSVTECIKQCSFSKSIKASTLESKILQDADRLEATGAISIMRTFSSGGQMNRRFYNPENPFGKNSTT
ncbi:MAG: HD domain-containing protein, partial [Patescibacteria group bacterium]|nr:HD domain-containing protein [Patescibacteria group bacterium]